MRYLTLSLLGLVLATALTACASSPSPKTPDYKATAAKLSADNSAKDLTASLRKRGHTVRHITCVDVSAKRQRCSGTVDGMPVNWRVDIDLATATRDFVVTP